MKKLLLLTLLTGVGLSLQAKKISFTVNNNTDLNFTVYVDGFISVVDGIKDNCSGEKMIPQNLMPLLAESHNEGSHIKIEHHKKIKITVDTDQIVQKNDKTYCYNYDTEGYFKHSYFKRYARIYFEYNNKGGEKNYLSALFAPDIATYNTIYDIDIDETTKGITLTAQQS